MGSEMCIRDRPLTMCDPWMTSLNLIQSSQNMYSLRSLDTDTKVIAGQKQAKMTHSVQSELGQIYLSRSLETNTRGMIGLKQAHFLLVFSLLCSGINVQSSQ